MDTDQQEFDYKSLLGYKRKESMKFSVFIERFLKEPSCMMQTSAGLILDSIKYFGYEIMVRSGEPILRYKVFQDLFSNGINAVYGQELCIKRIIDVIESVDKEAGPKRGLVLVGPPASGKTNVVDLISQAIEEYTKQTTDKVYTFFWKLGNDDGRELELRSSLMPNPLLLFPITLQLEDGRIIRPRDELFQYLKDRFGKTLRVPSYYEFATPDKRTLDILMALMQNPRNSGKELYEIIEEYVRIEELEFSNSQGRGIANVDDMSQLKTYIRPFTLSAEDVTLLNEHLQGKFMFKYEGSMLSSNRGLLHIHDAFGLQGNERPNENDYKPLLMLLGSGKTNLESTQASLDNTVIMTTNLEEMQGLERQLTSSKLLDRIERVPVNYLLDCVSEMDILNRDMANIVTEYNIDPNLFRMASYYSVMTRLLPPQRKESYPKKWSEAKKELYSRITPEQKLFIYAFQSEDPIQTIKKLPPWHPFRNECFRLGINIFNEDELREIIVLHPAAVKLEDSGLFTNEELKLIDDEFMRVLKKEHYPEEGKFGLSIRQLQNIMRNTIVNSDGNKVTVNLFLNQLETLFSEGPTVHHWLEMNVSKKKLVNLPPRKVGDVEFKEKEANYSDYLAMIKIVRALYFDIIRKEITVATVDRDPKKIEMDLRKYLQHALLDKAQENKAFSHILIPRYTYIDNITGKKIDTPDLSFMPSVEKILAPEVNSLDTRKEMARKYIYMLDKGELVLEEGKTTMNSKGDNLLDCFANEYNQLLSHRRAVEGINAELLRDAFFHRSYDVKKYEKCKPEMKEFVENVIQNMRSRFNYSEEIAVDTVIFAIRNEIIDFKEIIN
jgi:predicted Ser/Thr protein kinase